MASVPLFGHGREVDRQDQRAHQDEREDAAEVVDRLGRLVHVRGHQPPGHHDRDHGQRQRDQEHRSPVEVLQQEAREQRPERRDRAAERRPQRDRLRAARPRPQRGDQRQRRRIRHARRDAAAQPRDEQHDVGRRERREQRHRDRERRPEDEHQLASVAVAERAEPEHRAREAERVADRDQVERRLRRVEVLADVRQRDVRDREVQVRDAGDDDQRREHEPARAGASEVAPSGLFASLIVCARYGFWTTGTEPTSASSPSRRPARVTPNDAKPIAAATRALNA